MRRLLITTTVVLSFLLLGSASASAETLSPWWHLNAVTQPTYIQPGTAKQQEWKLTLAATGGSVDVELGVYGAIKITVGEPRSELRATIEGVLRENETFPVGERIVEVQAQSGPNNKFETYEITLTGQLTYTHYFEIYPYSEHNDLTGGPAKLTIEQPSEGRSDGVIEVTATNLGDAQTSGPVTIADALPAGLEAVQIEGTVDETNISQTGGLRDDLACSLKGLSCTFTPGESLSLHATRIVAVEPYEQIRVQIAVNVTGAQTGAVNRASVVGGGTLGASVSEPLTISDDSVPFGVSSLEMRPEEAGGALDAQAGSHPFQLTTTYVASSEDVEGRVAGGQIKDLRFQLPPGSIGNPTPFTRCTLAQFLTSGKLANGARTETECPQSSILGMALSRIRLKTHYSPSSLETMFPRLLFNLEPAPGEPARFGFIVEGEPVELDTAVRTGGDYGVTVTVKNITQKIEFLSSEVTFWGVPGDEAHNGSRGEGCFLDAALRREGKSGTTECPAFSQLRPPPLLSLPTSCPTNPGGQGEPLHTTVEGDSWAAPLEGYPATLNTAAMPALDGCNRLTFEPQIKVTPDAQQASKPTGLTVDVHVPQEGQLNPEGLAQANIRDITVKLPAGVAINPSSGDGLEACSEGLAGFQAGRGVNGFGEFVTEPGVSYPLFSPYLPGSIAALAAGDQELLEPGKDFCPNASKVGEVTIKTPLLPNPLKGFVYLAAQEANPFDSVLAMYLVAEDPVSGSLVKLPGRVMLCQGAGEVIAGMTCQGLGQIVSTFENNPQLPFEDAEIHFFGGERAPLATPSRCGSYTTEASYTPWSGEAQVHGSSTFQITSGPGGAPCPGAQLPFSPSLTGGALNVNAGAFSPFTLTMNRLPGEQNLQSIEAHLPPGLSGILSGVQLCPEPQANEGRCPESSLIGETTVGVGVGGEPFTVKGGKFYITGPYNGRGGCTVGEVGCAPFGITFEVPAKAGPYDFAKTKDNHPACDCVLVRGRIEVNPITAALTVSSNPPGTPDAIPTSLEGIPLEIQHVNAITTRSNFQFNPTNCNKMEVTGTIHSSEGSTDTIGVPFQVTNCRSLNFTPKFTVSTSGKTSRSRGASLTVKLSYPKAPFGSQANISKVKVDLPKQLPSRLTTLQKACTAAQFQTNPAGCPAASIVGHAEAITPLIPVPLSGPAYFVSYGSAKFPELVIALQGYGVTVDLHGETFINKAGITSSTFKTVPDAPVGSFELTLPQGRYSALAANGNLCKSTLKMPTMFTAQNGAVIHQSTPITVTGCAKHLRHKGKKSQRRKK